jgi:hypothetical protein
LHWSGAARANRVSNGHLEEKARRVTPSARLVAKTGNDGWDSQLQAWVFNQDELWLDARGCEQRIDLMSAAELETAIGVCERRADEIQLILLSEQVTRAIEELGCYGPNTEPGIRLQRCLLESQAEPLRWLRQTPLLRQLRLRSAGRRLVGEPPVAGRT